MILKHNFPAVATKPKLIAFISIKQVEFVCEQNLALELERECIAFNWRLVAASVCVAWVIVCGPQLIKGNSNFGLYLLIHIFTTFISYQFFLKIWYNL